MAATKAVISGPKNDRPRAPAPGFPAVGLARTTPITSMNEMIDGRVDPIRGWPMPGDNGRRNGLPGGLRRRTARRPAADRLRGCTVPALVPLAKGRGAHDVR